jgi:hypothetical protein
MNNSKFSRLLLTWINHLRNLVFILSDLNLGYTILFFSNPSYFIYLSYFNFYLWLSILELFITLLFSLTFYNWFYGFINIWSLYSILNLSLT